MTCPSACSISASTAFQPVLKFAAVFTTRDECAYIQRDQSFLAKAFRNITVGDTLCQSFHNRCFSDTGFTDEYGVVFASAGKDLHHTTDFVIASDNRIKFPRNRCLCEFSTESGECLILILWVLIGDPLVAADVNECLEDFVFRYTRFPKILPTSVCFASAHAIRDVLC